MLTYLMSLMSTGSYNSIKSLNTNLFITLMDLTEQSYAGYNESQSRLHYTYKHHAHSHLKILSQWTTCTKLCENYYFQFQILQLTNF